MAIKSNAKRNGPSGPSVADEHQTARNGRFATTWSHQFVPKHDCYPAPLPPPGNWRLVAAQAVTVRTEQGSDPALVFPLVEMVWTWEEVPPCA